MDIDERLDRLVQRQARLAESLQMLTESAHSLPGLAKTHERSISEIMEGTARLLRVARVHDRR